MRILKRINFIFPGISFANDQQENQNDVHVVHWDLRRHVFPVMVAQIQVLQ